MKKVRLFIITNSIILSAWLIAAFFTAADGPVEVADSPTPPSTITLHEVE